MSDESFDPWKSLASELGVDPNAAPPPPPPAPVAPTSPTSSYTPSAAPEPKKVASDWMALANDLGIEVPPEPEQPIKKKDPVAELLGWPAQARAPEPKKPEAHDADDFEEREPWDADDVRGRWGKDEDLDKPLAEDEAPPTESRYDRQDDRGGERGEERGGDRVGNREDGPPRGRRRRGGRGRGRGRDRDDRVQGERSQGDRVQGDRVQGERSQGERSQSERSQGERSQGERGESRGRGRGYRDRDDRRPRDEAIRSEEPRLDDELDLVDDDAPAAEFGEGIDREREPAGEDAQDRKRPRRRGRRRGRGRERSERGDRNDPPKRRAPANTGHSDEPDTVAFGEDLEDIDEVERHDELIGEEFAAVGAEGHEIDMHDDEDDGLRGGGRNSVRDIMTWKEAIGIIIETNMQERARNPRSGGHGGHGGHGGRGRRGGRRNG
jgi:hypothetical protein